MKLIGDILIDFVNKMLRMVGREQFEDMCEEQAVLVLEENAEDVMQYMHMLQDPRFYGPDYD